MEKVLIDLSTLQKNPKAGQYDDGVYHRVGTRSASLTVWGKQLDFLSEENGFLEQSRDENSSDGNREFVYQIMIALETSYLDKIKESGNTYTLESTADYQTIYCRPFTEPDYLYQYQHTLLACSNCFNKTEVNDIEEDYIWDGEDERHVYICPECGEYNTFPEHEFETIQEALRRQSLTHQP